jgi:hypothetical protein
MRGRNPVGVQHANRIDDQVATRVPRGSHVIRDRAASVAVVVTDHESPAIREHPAEALLPPEHRPANAHHEQNRRVRRIPERLGAEPDPIRFDHSLRQLRSSSPERFDAIAGKGTENASAFDPLSTCEGFELHLSTP